MDLSRRRFILKHRAKDQQPHNVLPWVNESLNFVDLCTRCNKCLSHCPENIIISGDGGFPEIDFNKGECTFCYECATYCEENLFNAQEQNPWDYKAKIDHEKGSASQCLASKDIYCQSCKESCEISAITMEYSSSSIPQPKLTLDNCNGCGACVSVCPTNSILIIKP